MLRPHEERTTLATTHESCPSLSQAIERLVRILTAEGIENPLTEQFTLACIIVDLYGCADSVAPDWISRTITAAQEPNEPD